MKVHEISLLSYLWFPIHREGWPFIGLFALATLILFLIWEPLGWIGVVLTVWCTYFFRNPDRTVPVREGLILSPADGVVQMIGPAVPPPELGMGPEPRQRVSVFMSVFNCHVNRVPASGRILATAYRPGKFVNASLDKASEGNERMSVRMALDDGREIAFVQIAGLVARRIKSDLSENQHVRAGERFGIIRFGSRVDVYLPEGASPQVIIGQIAVGGQTVIADLLSTEPAREAEIR